MTSLGPISPERLSHVWKFEFLITVWEAGRTLLPQVIRLIEMGMTPNQALDQVFQQRSNPQAEGPGP